MKKSSVKYATSTTQQFLTDFGIGFNYYRYSEPRIYIEGPMFNVFGSLGYVKKAFRMQGDLYFSTYMGANTYHGLLLDQPNTSMVLNSKDWYINGAAKLGVTLLDKKETLFAYIGLGYRFLRNHISDDEKHISSYRRYQGYLYLPIGFQGELPVNKKSSLIGNLEYRMLLFGHHTAKMTDVGSDNDAHFVQKFNSGNGVRISFGSRFYTEHQFSVKVMAYWDAWFIDASANSVANYVQGQLKNTLIEPKNQTNEFGINVALSF